MGTVPASSAQSWGGETPPGIAAYSSKCPGCSDDARWGIGNGIRSLRQPREMTANYRPARLDPRAARRARYRGTGKRARGSSQNRQSGATALEQGAGERQGREQMHRPTTTCEGREVSYLQSKTRGVTRVEVPQLTRSE